MRLRNCLDLSSRSRLGNLPARVALRTMGLLGTGNSFFMEGTLMPSRRSFILGNKGPLHLHTATSFGRRIAAQLRSIHASFPFRMLRKRLMSSFTLCTRWGWRGKKRAMTRLRTADSTADSAHGAGYERSTPGIKKPAAALRARSENAKIKGMEPYQDWVKFLGDEHGQTSFKHRANFIGPIADEADESQTFDCARNYETDPHDSCESCDVFLLPHVPQLHTAVRLGGTHSPFPPSLGCWRASWPPTSCPTAVWSQLGHFGSPR